MNGTLPERRDNHTDFHFNFDCFLPLLFGTGNITYTTHNQFIYVDEPTKNGDFDPLRETPWLEIVKGLAIIKEYLIWLGEVAWNGRICRFYDTERKENRLVRFINALTGEALPTHPNIMRILTTRNGY